MLLSRIKLNPKNPRLIKDEKFKKLVQSLKDFPKMMSLRPIIIDENDMILGGNMRYKALQELGYREISDEWVKKDSELTAEEKREFIVKDNINFGEFDYDMLSADFSMEELSEWGMDGIELGKTAEEKIDSKDAEEECNNKYSIIVDVMNENEQNKLYTKLQEMGHINLKKVST